MDLLVSSRLMLIVRQRVPATIQSMC